MKADDNIRSWTPAPNYEGISRGIKEIFLDGDGRITRAII